MKLPNAHLAIVEEEKITEYLLNSAHPDNGGKAAFFHRLGFHGGDWATFAGALRGLADTGEVTKNVESVHGPKYIVDGRLDTRAGSRPWCGASGLLTAEWRRHGWSRRTRTKNRSSHDQGT
jgi:hypothetical protein